MSEHLFLFEKKRSKHKHKKDYKQLERKLNKKTKKNQRNLQKREKSPTHTQKRVGQRHLSGSRLVGLRWGRVCGGQRHFQLGRCSASNSASILSFLILTFAGRSNLVCRPKSGAGRAARRETIARGRANPTRKRVFGGAWPPSSPVRRAARARPGLLAHAERVMLCAA